MSGATAGNLATLGVQVDANSAKTDVQSFNSALDAMAEKGMASTELLKRSFMGLSGSLAAGVIGRKFIDETSEAQFAMAQLEARVKSTGGVAGASAADLRTYAEGLQQLTTFTDDAVMRGEAMLLTFDKIRGPVVKEATQAIVDMAAAMGTDLQGAAIQVGKALQDPEQGLTALRRSGVSFNETQIATIKHLYDTGRAVEGQRMILAELNKEFGGAAVAARDTFGGALKGLENDFADLFKATKEKTSGVVDSINALGGALRFVGDNAETFKVGIGGVAAIMAGNGLASLMTYNAGLRATALASAEAAAAEVARARATLEAATALRFATAAGLSSLTTLAEAETAVAVSANAMAAAQARASLSSRLLGTVFSAPIVVATTAAYGLTIAIDKWKEAEDALIDAQDRDSAAASRLFQARNPHLAQLRAAAEAAAAARAAEVALSEAYKAAVTALEEKVSAARTDLQVTQTHIPLLTQMVQLERERAKILKQINDEQDRKERVANTVRDVLSGGQTPRPGVGVAAGLTLNDAVANHQIGLGDPMANESARVQANIDYVENRVKLEDASLRAILGMNAAEAAEEARIRETFLKDTQRAFAGAFESIFNGGTATFRDLFDEIRRMLAKLTADFLAQKLMDKLAGSTGSLGAIFGRGSSASAGSAASAIPDSALGMGASSFAVPAAGLALAVTGIVSTLVSQADEAREAARQFEANRVNWSASLDAMVRGVSTVGDKFSAPLQSLLSNAETAFFKERGVSSSYLPSQIAGSTLQSFAATPDLAKLTQYLEFFKKASQGEWGSNVAADNTLRETYTDLQRLNAEYQKFVAQAGKEMDASLEVRELRAKGLSAEASTLELKQRQEKELQDAIAAGYDKDRIAKLEYVQGLERTAEATNKLTGATLNIPQWFKRARAEFGATQPVVNTAMMTPTKPSGDSSGGTTIVQLVLDGKVAAQTVLDRLQDASQELYGTTTRWNEVFSV